MVREKLHGYDTEDALQTVHRVGDLEVAAARHLLSLGVAGLADEERLTSPGHHLKEAAETLGVDRVPGDHQDQRHLVINKSQRSVLQLPRQDPLAVHVCELLDLQSSLQASGYNENKMFAQALADDIELP